MKLLRIITIILFILIIISFVSGIVAPRFFKQIEKPPRNPVYSQMNVIKYAINTYKLNTGSLPQTLEDLLVCPKELENTWAGPYLKESQLYDPWDNMYIFEYGYRLQSLDADGIKGGDYENAGIEKFTGLIK